MKRLILWILVTVALCVILWQVGRLGFRQVLAHVDLNVRPFVSTQVQYVVKGGQEVITNRETVARTRNGAEVHAGEVMINDQPLAVRKIELPDGYVAMIIDSLHSKSSGHKSSQRLAAYKARLQNPPANCLDPGELPDGEEVLAAQRALRITSTQPDQLGRFILWRLPNYNCVTVQMIVQRRTAIDAEWQTTAGSHLTSFTEVDPDPRLFTGHANYDELPPSQQAKRFAASRNLTLPKDCPKCMKDETRQDQGYLEAQK